MTIECPNCQKECLSREEPIPAEGLQIECPHCHFAFTMRTYDGGDSADAAAPSPPDAAAPHPTPAKAAAPPSFPPLPKTFRRTPYWLVQAFEAGQRAAPPRGPGDAHLTEDPGTGPLQLEEDIPILVDDSVYGPGDSPETQPFLSEPIPARGRRAGARPAKARRPKTSHLVLLVAALAAVLLLLWRPGFRAVFERAKGATGTVAGWISSGDDEEGGLNFSNYKSDFVARTAGGGSIFVIEGKVTNNYAKPCHSIRVKGVLFDERGQRSDEESAYCGNILPAADLASASEESIRKRLQNPVGSNLSNLSIPPGQSIPFMLVFFDPPEKLSEFSIEIAGYNLQESSPE